MSRKRLESYLPPSFITLVFMVAYGIFYAYGMPLLMDPDTPWHLAAGYKILELGKLPASDPWSFTAGNQPWYLTSWGWDVVLASVHKLGGFKLLFIFVMGVSALAIALLTHCLIRRGSAGIDAVLLTVIMVALTLMDFATARPHLITFIYIICFNHILFITRHERNMHYIAWLPIIALLWVNTHSSFFIMFSFLGAYLLEALLMREMRRSAQLILISAFCFMALYINPYGKTVYTALVSVFSSPVLQRINEWQPFAWDAHYGTTGWVAIFVGAFLLGRGLVFYADAVIAFAWLIALIQHQRNACIFVMVTAPFMGTLLQGVLQRFSYLRIPREDVSKAVNQSIGRATALALAGLVLFISWCGIDVWRRHETYEVSHIHSAEPAVAFFKEHCAGKHFLTDYTLSGLLIWRTRDTCQVFIDSREATAYPAKVLLAYMSFTDLSPNWWQQVNAYKIDGMFLGNNNAFVSEYASGHYRDHWDQVFHDDTVSIYLRK